MEDFFEGHLCPIGRMVTIWGERMGLEEWAIREACEEYWESNKDKQIDSIDISWDVLAIAEGKTPVIKKKSIEKGDSTLRTEINRLRGVLANLREAISDIVVEKEDLYGKVESLQGQSNDMKERISSLAQDNVAFNRNLIEVDEEITKKIIGIGDEMEAIRLAAELDKLEAESEQVKTETKTKKRWWGK